MILYPPLRLDAILNDETLAEVHTIHVMQQLLHIGIDCAEAVHAREGHHLLGEHLCECAAADHLQDEIIGSPLRCLESPQDAPMKANLFCRTSSFSESKPANACGNPYECGRHRRQRRKTMFTT